MALSCDVNAKPADNVATKEARPKIVMHDEVYRYVKGIYHVASVNASDPRCELDSHANTCVAGSSTLRVSDEGREVTVHGYSDELAPMTAPVMTVATLWLHPETRQPYTLAMHESLYFRDQMVTTLICPNQVRANGIKVEDVPRQFDPPLLPFNL